jgi:hypothetical protein
VDEIPDFLLRSGLSESERRAIGQVHPAFMGGEYLPDLKQDEVEIARITIASVTQDVTSVLARRGRSRIYYRVIDEYGGDTLSGRNTRTSKRPLTLGELEAFFNSAWSIFDVLDMNFGGGGYDLKAVQRFVVGVDSQFYPQIGFLYSWRIQTWAAAQRTQQALAQEVSPME